jgi:hypothetical protein
LVVALFSCGSKPINYQDRLGTDTPKQQGNSNEYDGVCLFVCSFVCSFVRLFVCSFVCFVLFLLCRYERGLPVDHSEGCAAAAAGPEAGAHVRDSQRGDVRKVQKTLFSQLQETHSPEKTVVCF